MTKDQIINIKRNIAAMSEDQAKEMLLNSLLNTIKITEIVKQKTKELEQVKQAMKAAVQKRNQHLN